VVHSIGRRRLSLMCWSGISDLGCNPLGCASSRDHGGRPCPSVLACTIWRANSISSQSPGVSSSPSPRPSTRSANGPQDLRRRAADCWRGKVFAPGYGWRIITGAGPFERG
jgi:hypothetical protein